MELLLLFVIGYNAWRYTSYEILALIMLNLLALSLLISCFFTKFKIGSTKLYQLVFPLYGNTYKGASILDLMRYYLFYYVILQAYVIALFSAWLIYLSYFGMHDFIDLPPIDDSFIVNLYGILSFMGTFLYIFLKEIASGAFHRESSFSIIDAVFIVLFSSFGNYIEEGTYYRFFVILLFAVSYCYFEPRIFRKHVKLL